MFTQIFTQDLVDLSSNPPMKSLLLGVIHESDFPLIYQAGGQFDVSCGRLE